MLVYIISLRLLYCRRSTLRFEIFENTCKLNVLNLSKYVIRVRRKQEEKKEHSIQCFVPFDPVVRFKWIYRILTKSLILAQDERWRRG